GGYSPQKYTFAFDRLPPNPLSGAIQVIFGGFFSQAKRIPRVREKYGQKKACFLLPVFLSDWRRSQSVSAKIDAKHSCPPRKVFAELFSKSDPFARRRPPAKSTLLHQTPKPFPVNPKKGFLS
ncbi:MAG: hypothetical protein IIX91_04470, partial [Clostridia bacterium]|nr:hypothetical protein [Clostridia bacterium]